MKRPLVGIAIFFSLGIATGEWLSWPLALLWPLFLLTFLTSIAPLSRTGAMIGLSVAIVTGGLLAHRLANTYSQPNHLLRLIGNRPQNILARAVITQEPVRMVYRRLRGNQERDFFFARIRQLDSGDGWVTTTGDVVVWLDEPPKDDQLRFGDLIEIRPLLRQPASPSNPGLFDYQTYLARRGVFYEARLRSAADVTVYGHEAAWWMDWGMWLQRRFLVSTAHGLEESRVGDEPVIVGLLRAMLVGFRPGLTNELAEPFMRTGTLHVFAVSGLHVMVIAGILVGILRFCRVHRFGCTLIALPLLLFYTIATGAPASAVRAFLMAMVVIIGWSLPRPSDLLNSLSAAAILILLWDPMQLFDPGFLLSFAAVLAIALLVPAPGYLTRLLYRPVGSGPNSDSVRSRLPGRWPDLMVRDPYLPEELLSRWRRNWYRSIRAVSSSLGISVAACVGTLPLIAYYFHLFTAINFLSNLVIVPLSSLAITVGFASFLADFLSQPIAAWLNNANYLFMKLMLAASEWFACVPMAYLYVKSPPLWLSALYYAGIGLFLCASVRQYAHRFHWATGIAVVTLAVGMATQKSDQTVTLTVLSVGNGSALFVDSPGETNDTLIDCGPLQSANFVLKPFLRAQGCDSIKTLILTHADVNHIGAIGMVLKDFQPRRIYDNGQSRWTHSIAGPLPAYAPIRLVAGATLPLSDRVGLRVLHPPSGRLASVADDAALVLQLSCGRHRILMTSDIGASVERKLTASPLDLRSDLLILGLHHREESCTETFLEAVSPQWVIVSCGGFGLPEEQLSVLRDRVASHGAQLLRTDRDGAAIIQLKPDRLEVKSFPPTHPLW